MIGWPGAPGRSRLGEASWRPESVERVGFWVAKALEAS